jgi:cobalamin biosynthesis protein CobD/CbiB
MPVGIKVWNYVTTIKIKVMELLVFSLAILTVASIIGLSMVSFSVAFKSLVKINALEDKLNSIQEPLKQEDLHCEYSGLPSVKAYEN